LVASILVSWFAPMGHVTPGSLEGHCTYLFCPSKNVLKHDLDKSTIDILEHDNLTVKSPHDHLNICKYEIDRFPKNSQLA
jgi:hypothetical protein